MVQTRSKTEVVPEWDSEGDAPEHVSLSSGRVEAQKLRKEERENKKRVQAEAKQRRQRSTVQQKTEEVPSDEQQAAPVADLGEEAGANPAEDEQELNFSKPANVSGLLDASIIDFLAAREKKLVEVSISTQEEEKPQTHKQAGKRKGRPQVNSLSSRVKVVLLEADRPSLANYQGALDFKRNRLFGDHVHRSLNMLPKPSST